MNVYCITKGDQRLQQHCKRRERRDHQSYKTINIDAIFAKCQELKKQSCDKSWGDYSSGRITLCASVPPRRHGILQFVSYPPIQIFKMLCPTNAPGFATAHAISATMHVKGQPQMYQCDLAI